MSSDIELKLKDVPDKYLIVIAQLVTGNLNDTLEIDQINRPILKPSVKNVYPLFVVQYTILALLGIVSNIVIIVHVMYYKLYKDITHAFIVNLALCHFVQCSVVLPITLMVMLLQNWIFGEFLCFFLPMLQDIPLHVAMISHILIAWDRMRWLGDPLKGRLPTFVCCCASWLTGMVIALPYPIYTTYLELGNYVQRLDAVGLCFVNLVDDMHEYMRGLFVIMYCGPTTLLAYLYIRTSRELRPPDGPFAVMMFEHRADIRNRQRNSTTTSTTNQPNRTDSTQSYDLYSAELDVTREKQRQWYLGSMAATQVLCVCPLMILRLAKMVLVETYENSAHFDFTYLLFVWIAFLPTVIFPWIYATGIISRTEKEKLRGYLRLSNRRNGTKDAERNVQVDPINETVTIAASETNEASIQDKDKASTINIISTVKKPQCRRSKLPPQELKKITESVNNSNSNITSSTYCNNTTSRASIDYENASTVSSNRDSNFERKWMDSNLRLKTNTFSDCDTFSQNDSSSTLERDLEIIDLLERERSMDIQDMMERERHSEFVRKYSGERRKLPDLGKICKSPRSSLRISYSNQQNEYPTTNTSSTYANATSFTKGPNSSAVLVTNPVNNTCTPQRTLSRKSSQNSSGRIQHGTANVYDDAGLFGGVKSMQMSAIENRNKRSNRHNQSSMRGWIKPHGTLDPTADLDFRENIFSDL